MINTKLVDFSILLFSNILFYSFRRAGISSTVKSHPRDNVLIVFKIHFHHGHYSKTYADQMVLTA